MGNSIECFGQVQVDNFCLEGTVEGFADLVQETKHPSISRATLLGIHVGVQIDREQVRWSMSLLNTHR